MTTYSTLTAANEARQKEWNTDEPSLSYCGNEMAGEIGETLEQVLLYLVLAEAGGRASNIIKKIDRERRGMVGSRATKDELASELGDVVICAYLAALREGINLDDVVEDKFNATSEKYGLSTRYRRQR